LRGYEGRKVVLGIRPEDMEDTTLVSEAPPERCITSTVDLEEALGSDVIVHFTIDAPQAITEDVKELAVDLGQEVLDRVRKQAEGGSSNVVARLNPRTRATKGNRIDLLVDTRRLHFFDADNGAGIYEAIEHGP
jgi:multiple sugar transport system ATP-binding protein